MMVMVTVMQMVAMMLMIWEGEGTQWPHVPHRRPHVLRGSVRNCTTPASPPL